MLSRYLKICTRPGLAAAAVALMLTLLPTDGTAQQEQQTRRVILSDLPIAEQIEIATLAEATGHRADELLRRARTADEAAEYRKAGELYEQSALLRTPGDEHGVKAYEAAGTAFFNAEKPARASRAWEQAASRALILGDVFSASENYMRAAMAAHAADDRVRVSDMGWKAYYLTESPQLSKAQRTKLRQHITVRPVTVAEAEGEIRTVPHQDMTLTMMSMVGSAELERLRNVETSYLALRDSLADTRETAASTASASERGTMTETIHFAHDRSDLSLEAKGILQDKIAIFRAHPSMRIKLTGYTSTPGTGAYNTALGLRRAAAARDYLVSKGIDESRIDIATRGENDLAVEGPDEVANAANRRGEFTILMAEVKVSQN